MKVGEEELCEVVVILGVAPSRQRFCALRTSASEEDERVAGREIYRDTEIASDTGVPWVGLQTKGRAFEVTKATIGKFVPRR